MGNEEERLEEFRNSILDAIHTDAQNRRAEEFPFRHHLGASLLGHTCQRYLYYTFRWVSLPDISSRTLRIFERGHTEEDKIIEKLRQIGLVIHTVDPNTGKQYRAPNLPAHLGGSMDGIVQVPAHMVDILGEYIPLECKTHNAKSATKTFKGELSAAYPQHYIQGNIYGAAINAKRFMYAGLNKNTDELYFEFPPVNPISARIYVSRGTDVVNTQAFKRLTLTEEKWRCKLCDFQYMCKKNKPASHVNCRSCQHLYPMDDGTWMCTLHNKFIEKYTEIDVAAQCKDWSSVI